MKVIEFNRFLRLGVSSFPIFFLVIAASSGPLTAQQNELTPSSNEITALRVDSLGSEEFSVSGMTCISCSQAIKGKLRSMDGVQDVKVDLKTGMVSVTHTAEAKPNRQSLSAAIEELGYKVEGVETILAAQPPVEDDTL